MKLLKVSNIVCAIVSLYHINYIAIMIFNKDGLNFDYPHLLGVNPIEILVLNFLINFILLVLILLNIKKIVWDKAFKIPVIVNIVFSISFVIYCVFLYNYLIAFYNN